MKIVNINTIPIISSLLHENYAIDIISEALLQKAQANIKCKEAILDGLYSREILIPKGTIITGAAHPEDYMEIMSSGKIMMLTGNYEKVIEAPYSNIGKKGIRKCALTLEDTTWTTYHSIPKHIDSVEKAEAYTIDYTNYYIKDSKLDYNKFLIENNLTEAKVQAMMDKAEIKEVPFDIFDIRESNINGKGIFLLKTIPQGYLIGASMLDGKETTLGRYMNHSHIPNTVGIIAGDGKVAISALRPILEDEELTIDYRQVFNTLKEILCQVG